MGFGQFMTLAYALRVPFFFVVGLCFGHLIQEAGKRQGQSEECLERERRTEFPAGVTHDFR